MTGYISDTMEKDPKHAYALGRYTYDDDYGYIAYGYTIPELIEIAKREGIKIYNLSDYERGCVK